MSKEWNKNMMIITLQISHHNRKTETILEPNEMSMIGKYKNFKKKKVFIRWVQQQIWGGRRKNSYWHSLKKRRNKIKEKLTELRDLWTGSKIQIHV